MASTASQVPVNIVEYFAVNPYLTVKKISEDMDIAYSTAQRGVLKLEAEGIIQETSGNKRDKVYCATKILSILEEPTKIYPDMDDE